MGVTKVGLVPGSYPDSTRVRFPPPAPTIAAEEEVNMGFIDVTLIEGNTRRSAKINAATVLGARAWWGEHFYHNPHSELLLAGGPPWSVRVTQDPAMIARLVEDAS